VLLAVTILLVIVATSIALVYELAGLTGDVLIAKHQEARELVDEYHREGRTLQQSAPELAEALSGIGLRVAIFDAKGHYLAGDKTLRPALLDRLVSGRFHPRPPTKTSGYLGVSIVLPRYAIAASPFGTARPESNASRTVGRLLYHETATPGGPGGLRVPGGPSFAGEPLGLAVVAGGYVAFAPEIGLLLTSLAPYWKVVATIALVAIALSWLIGRLFARQALRPIDEVTDSLQALAGGDFTQRRFVMAGGDEVATLTAAYNDAVIGVSKAMDERHAVEERMRQFVADAGHELRTPLTVIGGYIDVLRRGALDEPKVARQILGTMALEKEHMRSLIDRLVRLARLEGESPPRDERIDVTELLRSQCDAARRMDDRRQIDYSVEGEPQIRGDRGELGEAIWNVVENALKYAAEAPIHLESRQSGDSTIITIRDEGPGMSEAERIHAFERFYRGDERGEIVGSGLGLAIAKRAVERAGGSIAIDSAPGHGTAVTITLKNARPA
jgi:two-component system OmpR family sensor kinase